MGNLLAALNLIVNVALLLLTPKPKREPKPFTPTSTMIIGVSMDRGPDLPGIDRWR